MTASDQPNLLQKRDPGLTVATFEKAQSREFTHSPLSQELCRLIAADGEMIEIARHARAGQSPPMLFTAAARFLALQAGSTGLDDLFAGRLPAAQLETCFHLYRAFVLDNAQAMQSLLERRSVNKNEIRRSACLRALLITAASRMGWEAVHLVDIGCSIGVNLLLDRFAVDYRPGEMEADNSETLIIRMNLKSGQPPQAPAPRIATRVGLDSDHLDPTDAADRNWVLSHILPEDSDQLGLMNRALDILAKEPPRILVGDATVRIGEVAGELSSETPIVFLHSLMLHQLKAAQKVRLLKSIEEISRRRPCARISMELAGELCQLRVSAPDASANGALMGFADMDAHWMTWQPS